MATSTDDPCASGTDVCDWILDRTSGNETARQARRLVRRAAAGDHRASCSRRGSCDGSPGVRSGAARAGSCSPPDSLTSRIPFGGAQPDPVEQEIELARRKARAESIGAALAGVVAVAIWVVAMFAIASVLGINLAPLLAGAGVAGVALGFGAQSLVRDCISGLFMLLEDQYGIGDQVDLGAASGTVERVSLRTTVVRGADGTVWHVPNGEVRRVGNQSKLWSMAVVDVDVAVDANLDAARAARPPGGGRAVRRPRVVERGARPNRTCSASSRSAPRASRSGSWSSRAPAGNGRCNARSARRSSASSTRTRIAHMMPSRP